MGGAAAAGVFLAVAGLCLLSVVLNLYIDFSLASTDNSQSKREEGELDLMKMYVLVSTYLQCQRQCLIAAE